VRTLLRGGRLVDGTGAEPVDGAGIVLEAGRIVAAGASDALPRGREERVVDLDGRTVMPGLI